MEIANENNISFLYSKKTTKLSCLENAFESWQRNGNGDYGECLARHLQTVT